MSEEEQIYKLKENVALKELKKYGFIKSWAGFYVYVDKNNYIDIEINPVTREIIEYDENLVLKQLEIAGFIER